MVAVRPVGGGEASAASSIRGDSGITGDDAEPVSGGDGGLLPGHSAITQASARMMTPIVHRALAAEPAHGNSFPC